MNQQEPTTLSSEAFIVSVNYDDPRWLEITHDSYAYANRDLGPEHFPVCNHGTSEVVMECIFFFYEPTTQEILDEIKRRGLRNPDRAETESFLDKYSELQRKLPFNSLCGAVVIWSGHQSIACVGAYNDRRVLFFSYLDGLLDRQYRFLAVRK